MNFFTQHLKDSNCTYFSHLKFAIYASFLLIYAAVTSLIHAIFPFLFKGVVELLVQEYGIRFTITFGSTATVGPLLIQTIDKSNYQLYNQYNFYESTDEFYTLSIVDDKLTVEMPTGKIVSLNDTFNYTQGIYQFKLT